MVPRTENCVSSPGDPLNRFRASAAWALFSTTWGCTSRCCSTRCCKLSTMLKYLKECRVALPWLVEFFKGVDCFHVFDDSGHGHLLCVRKNVQSMVLHLAPSPAEKRRLKTDGHFNRCVLFRKSGLQSTISVARWLAEWAPWTKSRRTWVAAVVS